MKQNFKMENKYCIDCINYPECVLAGVCADDDACEDFKQNTDPEEPGNN